MVPFIFFGRPYDLPFIGLAEPSVGPRHSRGFTLVEAVVVMTIIGILAAIAFPSFRTLMQNQRLGTQANDFIADLSFARSEAVKRVGQVGVCVSIDGATCGGTDWATGRVIFADLNNNGWDPNDLVLRVRDSIGGNNTFNPNPAGTAVVLFSARGTLAGAAVNFAICDGRGQNYGKAVRINAAGQARVDTNPPASCN
jgi:type IV fimbrial biogenesis protein FimT